MSSSSSGSGCIFQLKVDPLTGNSEWVVIEEHEAPDASSSSPPQQPLLATTSYLDMLNDSPRNSAFRQAIDKTITKPCHVLDIGAGTGLLSMMAARAMDSVKSTSCLSSEGMVTACESYLPMVKLMRKVLRLNGMENKVRLINKRSDELEFGVDIHSRADILVSEILDSELLGEGLIPTLQNAHDNLLVENPQTVPYRATIYGQLVESEYLWKLHDLYNNEAKASDNIRLVPMGKETILCVKSKQFVMHCSAMKDEIKLLSEPFKIFEFDFWRRPESQGKTKVHIKAINDGTVHAVISWWILQLDCEGRIFYSTGPKWIRFPFSMNSQSSLPSSMDWCDHWKQCVYFIPGKGLSVSKEEELHLHAYHNDISISYNLETQDLDTETPSDEFARDNQLILSPERVAIYGDNNWRCSMIEAVKKAVELLVGEPFYYGNNNVLPWQNLRFWKQRTMLDPVLSADALIMPCKGILKASAMSLPGIWRSRRYLREIEGFDHSIVNATLGACGDSPDPQGIPCLPFFIWQSGENKGLSEAISVLEFDFTKPIHPCLGKTQVEFKEAGICHGFVLWIDWVMDMDNSIVLSRGPEQRYWKQGVKLLSEPVRVGKHGSAEIEASLNPSDGELIHFNYTFFN